MDMRLSACILSVPAYFILRPATKRVEEMASPLEANAV